MGENTLLRFRRDGSGSSREATNTEYLLLLFAVVNMDGKVQTARNVKCTPDAFMARAASHGNVIVLKAGAELFAIKVRFYIQSEGSCCSFDQSQSHSSRFFPRFLKVLYFPALSATLFSYSSMLILPI